MPKPSPEHDMAYAQQILSVLAQIKAIQKKYLIARRALDQTIFDMESKDQGSELERHNKKKADKAILRKQRVEELNKFFQNLLAQNQTAKKDKKEYFSKTELSGMVSYAIDQIFEKEKVHKSVIDNITGYKHTTEPLTLTPNQLKAIEKIEKDRKAKKQIIYKEKQVIIHAEYMQEKKKMLANLPQDHKAILTDLNAYIANLKKPDQKLHENEKWEKSNQVAKLKIAQDSIPLMSKKIDVTNLIETIKDLRSYLKSNREATGNMFIHGLGKLHTILKRAEKVAIESVPNGKTIIGLHDYIEEKTKEIKSNGPEYYENSKYVSDLPKKVELAKKALNQFKKGSLSQIQIEDLIKENEGYTQKEGFHRSGQLHSILKGAEKNLSASSSNKPTKP